MRLGSYSVFSPNENRGVMREKNQKKCPWKKKSCYNFRVIMYVKLNFVPDQNYELSARKSKKSV